jgi:hypothetical protein
VLLGNGDGTFQKATTHDSGGVAANSIAIADVNGDGQPDLVMANRLGENNGDGTVGLLLQKSKNTYPTSISIESSLNPSSYGQSVTFTAVVTSAHGLIPNGGVVTFFDGETAVATATTTNETATFITSTLSAKLHLIRATYSGDATFEPCTNSMKQKVNKNK